MSLRVKASLVERQGSMAFMSLIILSVVNVPAAVIKVLGVPLYVGRFNILVSFQEMMPLSVQHWRVVWCMQSPFGFCQAE